MNDFFDTPLSQKEYDAVVAEISERFLNLMHAEVREKMRQALEQANIEPGKRLTFIARADIVEITFSLNVVVNDVIEVVSGIRRHALQEARVGHHR